MKFWAGIEPVDCPTKGAFGGLLLDAESVSSIAVLQKDIRR